MNERRVVVEKSGHSIDDARSIDSDGSGCGRWIEIRSTVKKNKVYAISDHIGNAIPGSENIKLTSDP